MEIVRFPGPLPVFRTLDDALRLYRLLWARSVLVATVVYALIAVLEFAQHAASGGLSTLLALLVSLSTLAGPVLVQGILIGIVRNVHEGERPEATDRLFAAARARFWRLLGASFVYAFGVGFGLLLLVVPGLIAASRWSLMPATVVLEGKSVGDARRRSRDLVRGHTVAVLVCIVIAYLVVALPAVLISVLVLQSTLGFQSSTVISFVWSSLSAPFLAHVLTAIYYRRSEYQRPVIHPDVLQWRNVWEGR